MWSMLVKGKNTILVCKNYILLKAVGALFNANKITQIVFEVLSGKHYDILIS